MSFLIFYIESIILFLLFPILIQCAQKIKAPSAAVTKGGGAGKSQNSSSNTTTSKHPNSAYSEKKPSPSSISALEPKSTITNKTCSENIAPVPLTKKRSNPDERSKKSARDVMMDSIKIMRGKKGVKKVVSLMGKRDDSDSQHTELINVPLGKAAEKPPPPSKLTSRKDQKINDPTPVKKVTFSAKIVKDKYPMSPSVSDKRTK